MTESPTQIDGVRLFDLKVFADPRGSFCEAFKASRAGGGPWVQWNVSRSVAGVVRGLHLHRKQTDYWHIVSGSVLAAVVDLRPASPSFRKTACLLMEASRPQAIEIPPGVVHGFRALSEVVLMYLLDREYDPSDELGVRWNDPELGLPPQWYGDGRAILSPRDEKAPRLAEAKLWEG